MAVVHRVWVVRLVLLLMDHFLHLNLESVVGLVVYSEEEADAKENTKEFTMTVTIQHANNAVCFLSLNLKTIRDF